MQSHLTERQLIEYEFKLASDANRKYLAEHLQQCGSCQQHLDQLRRKFAALDLLSEDVQISEELISRVIKQAGENTRARRINVRRYGWIAAAAMVVLAVSLFMVGRWDTGVVAQHGNDKTSQEVPMLEAMRERALTAKDKPGDDRSQVSYGWKGEVSSMSAAVAGAGIAGDVLEQEQAPFAPASAIELVTLPRRENVQLTIYNSADLTLVRERRNLTLKKGWNWLQFMWANTLIDPTSISLRPLEKSDKIDIQQLVFPARLREVGRWLIKSGVSGQVPFEITYFTSGLSWRAFYMGTLSEDEKMMSLEGYVRVSNSSGEDYEDAQTRLIVGQVHVLDEIAELARRQWPYGRPGRIGGFEAYDMSGRLVSELLYMEDKKRPLQELNLGELRRKDIKKEGLSEYFLYTIEGTETISDKWGKRLLSFEADDIPVASLYKYDEDRYGTQTVRFISFSNDEEHELGETPIPNGMVRIYGLTDSDGYLSYVGGTSTKYIPVGEEIELNLGPARLIKVEPVLMTFKTGNYVFDTKDNVVGWDEVRTWRIDIANARTLPVEIEITRGFETAYWQMQFEDEGVSYEKCDATHARFKLEVLARDKRAFEYMVRTYHGVREEELMQLKGKSKK